MKNAKKYPYILGMATKWGGNGCALDNCRSIYFGSVVVMETRPVQEVPPNIFQENNKSTAWTMWLFMTLMKVLDMDSGFRISKTEA